MNVSIVSVSRRAAAPHCGHVDVQERLVARQRVVAGAAVVDGLGQQDRQVLLGDGHRAAGLAVDDRDRRAPVALAADQPVAQPVDDRRLALALLAQPRRRSRAMASAAGWPVNGPELTMTSSTVCSVKASVSVLVGVRVLGHDDLDDRQAEPLREGEVALVVGRDGHDRARAVGRPGRSRR